MFVAVRQGDAAVFVGACGDTGVIDANRFRTAEILAGIDHIGTRKLKWMAVTHYDADHLGDIVSVATSPGVTVGRFYDRGGSRAAKDSNTYRTYFDYVTASGNRTPLDIGDSMSLCTGVDRVTFTVVSAGTDGTAAGGVPVTEENDRGLCFHVEYHDFDLATCGDINGTGTGSRSDVESAVAPVIGDVEVVKVNHHGSSYSSNATYVNTLRPEVAVISVGKNSFGHPSQTVIDRWDAHADVFQTQNPTNNAMIDGNTTIFTQGVTTFTAAASASSRTITRLMDEDTP
jgi:beta-lactamase superfamily II metal-dependent hydrolase